MVAPVLLAACLQQKGIAAAGYDFNIKFVRHFQTKSYWLPLKQLMTLGQYGSINLGRRAVIDMLKFTKRQIQLVHDQYCPRRIGLSVFTHESIPFLNVMIYVMRRWFPTTQIVLGGRALELDHEGQPLYSYLQHQQAADLIVVGDAETSLPLALQSNLQGVFHSPPQDKNDLDNIPLPQWQDYDMKEYQDLPTMPAVKKYFSITGSKGCVRSCSFCDVASFWPKYIYRDGAKVAREMIENYQRTGINSFWFSDNLMNGSVSHYRRMNEILAAEIPNEILYGGYAIFRSRTHCRAKDFAVMAKAGCYNWRIGVESGSHRVRQHMKKGFSDADIDWTANQLYDNGISQTWLLMVGYPTETRHDFELTKQLLSRYAHINHDRMITLGITSTFMLLKSSPLWHEPDYQLDLAWSNDHQRYWTSSTHPDNTFIERANRWLELVNHCEDLGYQWYDNSTKEKTATEVRFLMERYNDFLSAA